MQIVNSIVKTYANFTHTKRMQLCMSCVVLLGRFRSGIIKPNIGFVTFYFNLQKAARGVMRCALIASHSVQGQSINLSRVCGRMRRMTHVSYICLRFCTSDVIVFISIQTHTRNQANIIRILCDGTCSIDRLCLCSSVTPRVLWCFVL